MKFYSKAERYNFVLNVAGEKISAKEAKKLFLADTWRGVRDEVGGVFFVARYIL